MHAIFVIVGCVIVVALLIGDYRRRDGQARAEGLAPLSRNQLRNMRRAANTGKPYTPKRRPYGSSQPQVPPYNRKR